MKRKGGNKTNQKEQHQKKKGSPSKDDQHEEHKRRGSLTDISITSSSNNGSTDSDEISSVGSDIRSTMASSHSQSSPSQNGDDLDSTEPTSSKASGSRTTKNNRNQSKNERTPDRGNGRNDYRFSNGFSSPKTNDSYANNLFKLLQEPLVRSAFNPRPDSVGSNAYTRAKNDEKLSAKVGFGIAASGIYDTAPTFNYTRTNPAKGPGYTRLVGEKLINWRTEFSECLDREETLLNSINVDWDSVMAHRMDLQLLVEEPTENKWIRGFFRNIIEGDFKQFWKKLHTIMDVLIARSGRKQRDVPKIQFFEKIMMNVVNMLKGADGFNVIMYLMTNETPSRTRQPQCFRVNHKFCTMAELILNILPASCAKTILTAQTGQLRRSAIHFAALSGVPCQMDLLMKFGLDPNVLDGRDQCPLYYALVRHSKTTFRQLMWNGADFTSVSKNVFMNECFSFYHSRMEALEKTMASWVKALCSGKYKVNEAATELHVTKLSLLKDNEYKVGTSSGITAGHMRQLNLMPKNSFYDTLEEKETYLVVFVVPVMYSRNDAIMPAENPHIVRVKLVEQTSGTPAHVIPNQPTLSFHRNYRKVDQRLTRAFTEPHNGFYYAWHLPKDIHLTDTPPLMDLDFCLETADLSKALSKNCLLWVQAFKVQTLGTFVKLKRD